MQGPKHKDACTTHPGKQYTATSRVAVQAPLWLCNDKGERVKELSVEDYEKDYHPKGKKTETDADDVEGEDQMYV